MQPRDDRSPATSRQLVARIDRGYYTRPSPLRWWRGWLAGAGLLVAVGWCAWGLLDPARHHAPGPVAAPHARWERDCQACHIPFTPIKDDAFLTTSLTRTGVDAKCEACHKAAIHHPLQLVAEAGSCASCHADIAAHRRRPHLVRSCADPW